jgi:DNA-binding transcriptional LysR family regulator
MELRHLRYFVTVAETGNISKAAQKLFIAQPPLSAQIKQLEEEIGVPLLVRLARGVTLTPAGQSFLSDAKAILARSQDAGTRARQLHELQTHTLRLGLMPSSTQSLLPGLLRALGAEKLNIDLQIREISPSTVQLQALRNAEIDLGVIRLGVEDTPPEARASIDDPYCLAINANHPLARSRGPLDLSKAAHEHFVGFTSHHQSDYFDQAMALCVEAGFRPEIKHSAGQFAGVLAMVASSLGVAIVPASCFEVGHKAIVQRKLIGSRYRSKLLLISQENGSPHLEKMVTIAHDQLEALSQRIQLALERS